MGGSTPIRFILHISLYLVCQPSLETLWVSVWAQKVEPALDVACDGCLSLWCQQWQFICRKWKLCLTWLNESFSSQICFPLKCINLSMFSCFQVHVLLPPIQFVDLDSFRILCWSINIPNWFSFFFIGLYVCLSLSMCLLLLSSFCILLTL
jgi:hypothetical protein